MLMDLLAKPKSSSATFTTNTLNNGEIVSVVIEDTAGSGCEFSPPGIPVLVTNYPVASLTSTSVTLFTICDGETPTFEATFTPDASYLFYIEGFRYPQMQYLETFF